MFKRLIGYTIAIAFICAGMFSTTAFASCSNGDTSLLLFPPWFHGLNCETVQGTSQEAVKITDANDIWVIVLNVAQWLIIAGGYVSVYFIIVSGFKYIIAAGEPQKITAAKSTLTNAIIGFVIVLASMAIVRTIQTAIVSGKLL